MSKVGEIIDGKYLIERVIGEGGMGTVFVAVHTIIGRKVAIKVLHPQYAQDQEAVTRFIREAKATAIIAHENIIEVTDIGQLPEGSPYLVMQLLEGGSLADRIERVGRLPIETAAAICAQILAALKVAHEKGIIHRDLKPENIFLTTVAGNPDFVKILDFGISKFVMSLQGEKTGNMTRTGSILGTPLYMAPEMARGEKVDHRIDIYAVGIMLYQMVTGCLPYDAPNTNALLLKIMTMEGVPPRQVCPDLPEEIEWIILKAMARNPDGRFFSASEFLAHLRRYLKKGASHGELTPIEAPKAQPPTTTLPDEPIPLVRLVDQSPPSPLTTMSMTDDEKHLTVREREKKGWVIATVAIVAVVGVGIAFLIPAVGKDGKKKEDQQSQQLILSSPWTIKPSAAKNPAPTAASEVTLKVSASPSDARISVGGQVLDRNPGEARVIAGTQQEIVVSADGYSTQRRVVTLKEDDFESFSLLPDKGAGKIAEKGKEGKKTTPAPSSSAPAPASAPAVTQKPEKKPSPPVIIAEPVQPFAAPRAEKKPPEKKSKIISDNPWEGAGAGHGSDKDKKKINSDLPW